MPDAAVEPAPRDESEVAWRLRRIKRSVLKDESAGASISRRRPTTTGSSKTRSSSSAAPSRSSARLASSIFDDGPLYGQVNLLSATAYDDSGELVAFGQSSGVAFFAVGAPVGQHGDWTARVAMNSGDVTLVDDGRRLHHPRARRVSGWPSA